MTSWERKGGAMTAEERAARFSWQQCPGGEGHDPGEEGFSYLCAKCHADLLREAEDEAWNAAIRAAARAVNETEGDPDLVILSLLSSNGGGRGP